jgi:hypothetical protein
MTLETVDPVGIPVPVTVAPTILAVAAVVVITVEFKVVAPVIVLTGL